MDEIDLAFANHYGINVARGFSGETQFSKRKVGGNPLSKEQQNELSLKYNKYKEKVRNEKTLNGMMGVLKVLDPTGVSSYSDVKDVFKNKRPIGEKVVTVAGAVPMLGTLTRPVKVAKSIDAGVQVSKMEKGMASLGKLSSKLDKVTPRTLLDTKFEGLSGKILDNTFNRKLLKGNKEQAAIVASGQATVSDMYMRHGLTRSNKTAWQTNANTAIHTSNISNKTADLTSLKDSGVDMYKAYEIQESINKSKNNKDKHKPAPKFAKGGIIGVDSRKKRIAPMLIGAAVSVLGGILGASKAAKDKKAAEQATIEQEQSALDASFNQQSQADGALYNNFEKEGQSGVQYYKQGGKIQENLSDFKNAQVPISIPPSPMQGGGKNPSLPISNGGFNTKGGNLVPIGRGVELVKGNRHNDTTIDGVSGVQLGQNGEVVAEVEDKEVIADGNVVYSDRLKYDKKKSYADMMVKLTKKRNKLESELELAPNKAKKNSIDRKLAGLNMAEEHLYKTQELHKETEGKAVANVFAFGGTINSKNKFPGGGVLPVRNPLSRSRLSSLSWMKGFYGKQKGGKYNGYDVNYIGNYRDPKDPDAEISATGTPNYNYDYTPAYKANMLTKPLDVSAGMNNGSLALIKGATSAASTIANGASSGADSKDAIVTKAASSVDAPDNLLPEGSITGGLDAGVEDPDLKYNTPEYTATARRGENIKGLDWAGIGKSALALAPKVVDNVFNAIQSKNAPRLPKLLHAVASPMETNVNVNPNLAEIRKREATLRKGILDNTSNSNNAKTNMIATSLGSSKQVDEVLANKQNQEMTLRNANAQNRQLVSNANIAQENERSMLEFQRQNELRSHASANMSNLVNDVNEVVTNNQVREQFDADVLANLSDDPKGSKLRLYASNASFMKNKSNRDMVYKFAKERNNTELIERLRREYSYE